MSSRSAPSAFHFSQLLNTQPIRLVRSAYVDMDLPCVPAGSLFVL